MKTKFRGGFSLIEALLVIAFVGALISIVVAGANSMIIAAKNDKIRTDAIAVVNAINTASQVVGKDFRGKSLDQIVDILKGVEVSNKGDTLNSGWPDGLIVTSKVRAMILVLPDGSAQLALTGSSSGGSGTGKVTNKLGKQ